MPIQDDLKAAIAARLPELDMVIGWGQGFDPLHHTPLFITSPEDLENLRVGPLAVHNLATYLPGLAKKKVGVVVKGCDSRSVVELLQENLIARENVVVFGLPCAGVVDLGKLRRALDDKGLDMAAATEARVDAGSVTVFCGKQSASLSLPELLADKCGRCLYPNAVMSDVFVGEPAPVTGKDAYQDVDAFEALPLAQRQEFWRAQMQRCIRCYACRNACPMCVCRDHCIAQTRDPGWASQRDGVEDKFFFQMIHASHLAGRCTECGECERACPVNIPILLLKRKLNREMLDLFDYRAGVDPDAKPPLLSFKVEEERINERGW